MEVDYGYLKNILFIVLKITLCMNYENIQNYDNLLTL